MSPFPPNYTSQPPTNSFFPNVNSEPSAPTLGSSNLSVDTPIIFPIPPNSTSPNTTGPSPPKSPTDKTEDEEKTSMDLDDLTARFEALKKKTHKQ